MRHAAHARLGSPEACYDPPDALARVAITVGDPAGIGPEIAAKAAADPRVRAVCEPIVFRPTGPALAVSIGPGVRGGRPGAPTTPIVAAVAMRRRGEVDAIATAPINKQAFAAGRAAVEGAHRSARRTCPAARLSR